MSAHTPAPITERRPGHLYVLLALYRRAPDHVEQFVEVETHDGKGSRSCRSFPEGVYRLLEFPDPAVHSDLLAALKTLASYEDSEDWPTHHDYNAARRAIARARGEKEYPPGLSEQIMGDRAEPQNFDGGEEVDG